MRHSSEKEVEEAEVEEEVVVGEKEEGKEKEEEGCAGIPFSSFVDLNRAVSSSAAIEVITSLKDEINGKESPETAA